jgi:hypothetical protein
MKKIKPNQRGIIGYINTGQLIPRKQKLNQGGVMDKVWDTHKLLIKFHLFTAVK